MTPELLIDLSIHDPNVVGFFLRAGGFPVAGEPDVELDRRYHLAKQAGFAVIASVAGIIRTVFLYAEGHEGFDGYEGPLPRGLDLEMDAEEVRSLLGEPHWRSPAGAVRYDFATFSLHIERAGASGAIVMVTVMAPRSVPGRG